MCKGKSRGPVRDLKYMPHVPTQVGNPGKHLVALLRSMANRGSPEALRGVQGPQVTHPPSSPFQLFYLDWCPGCQSACQPLHIIRLPHPSLIHEHSFLNLFNHHRQILAVTSTHGQCQPRGGQRLTMICCCFTLQASSCAQCKNGGGTVEKREPRSGFVGGT